MFKKNQSSRTGVNYIKAVDTSIIFGCSLAALIGFLYFVFSGGFHNLALAIYSLI